MHAQIACRRTTRCGTDAESARRVQTRCADLGHGGAGQWLDGSEISARETTEGSPIVGPEYVRARTRPTGAPIQQCPISTRSKA